MQEVSEKISILPSMSSGLSLRDSCWRELWNCTAGSTNALITWNASRTLYVNDLLITSVQREIGRENYCLILLAINYSYTA